MDQIIEVQNVQRRENGQIFLTVLQVKKLSNSSKLYSSLKCLKWSFFYVAIHLCWGSNIKRC